MKITKKTKRNRCHQLLPCYLGGLLFRIGLGVLCDFQCLVLHDLHCCLHARCHDLGAGGFWGQVWWVSRGFTHQLLVVSVDISEIYIYIYQLISVDISCIPLSFAKSKVGECSSALLRNPHRKRRLERERIHRGTWVALRQRCCGERLWSNFQLRLIYWYWLLVYYDIYIIIYMYIYIHWGYICMYIGYWFVSKNMCRV